LFEISYVYGSWILGFVQKFSLEINQRRRVAERAIISMPICDISVFHRTNTIEAQRVIEKGILIIDNISSCAL